MLLLRNTKLASRVGIYLILYKFVSFQFVFRAFQEKVDSRVIVMARGYDRAHVMDLTRGHDRA